MTSQETRPFPVPAHVVMRCTLFALATSNARLQAYNEESGVIVATLVKRLGLNKREVVARVRGFEQTSQLEIQAPDESTLKQLLLQIGTYVRDGAQVEANARIQWIEWQQQAESQQRRQRATERLRGLLPGISNSVRPVATGLSQPEQVQPEPAAEVEEVAVRPRQEIVPIPDNPGILVKNRENRTIELKPAPDTFIDRSDHLELCNACAATLMRGSLYCPNCGRPVTLAAVQPDLRGGVEDSAASSLRYALMGLAFNLIPLLLLIVPALLRSAEEAFMTRLAAGLTVPVLVAALALGIAPMIFMARRAMAKAQRASWYFNLSATPARAGRTRGILGSALAWFDVYLAVAWVLFVVVALF